MDFECEFDGPLLRPGFVAHALPSLLLRHGLCSTRPDVGWGPVHLGLRDLAASGGAIRVLRYFVSPLATALGYSEIRREEAISTRDGAEDAGYLLRASDGSSLRVWPVGSDIDLDVPLRRGSARRASPLRRAGHPGR